MPRSWQKRVYSLPACLLFGYQPAPIFPPGFPHTSMLSALRQDTADDPMAVGMINGMSAMQRTAVSA
jgi:hypothetical protein